MKYILYNLKKTNFIVPQEYQNIKRFSKVFSLRIKNTLSESPNFSRVMNLLFQFFHSIFGIIQLVRKFRKTSICYHLIRTRTRSYQGLRKVGFLKNFAYVLNQRFLSEVLLQDGKKSILFEILL